MAEPGTPPVLGILGGSGIYDIGGLTSVAWRRVKTPWGDPSDALMFAEFQGMPLVFLPRHGRGHPIPPSEINFAANIDALKRSGVTEIISLSAVGSLREELAPGAFVLVDQFIDRTFARRKSFFGRGLVAHVSMADPVCGRLGDEIATAAAAHGIQVLRGGTYVTMEGPQFSTRAESELYRRWGASVVGMTNMPEAKLAREAELCYATVAMVTDYDCWHPHHADVTVERVVKVLLGNAERARGLLKAVAPRLLGRTGACARGCHRALDAALITAPEKRDPKVMTRLAVVAGRIFGAAKKRVAKKARAKKPAPRKKK